ncbi:MAG TPA: GMC family oxidoreductase [Streptosporangiaceae bacterium]
MTIPSATPAVEHADVVIVGSGFGGSVSACRLAEAGLSVVVLERGNAYPPNSFPRTPAQMSKAFWRPAAGLYGMFDVWRFSGCDSVVSSGLGGGSLIYANVMLRKDEHWFVQDDPLPHGGYETWPVTRTDLDPHYDAVEQMLNPVPYPLDTPGYSAPKTHALRDAAAELGLACQLPPLAVSFAPKPGAAPGIGLPIVDPDYGNLHGRPRSTCRLCGECDIGCNNGAKNSLDYNYLSAAKHHGADLRTGHEVKAIRPRPAGGYEVDYIQRDLQDPDAPIDPNAQPTRIITCDRLVLAAGTFGTTYLLLRNRPYLRHLSAALGTRFSSNGDILSFLVNAKNHHRTRPLDASRGPVITTAIRLADEHDGPGESGRGAYIEDGGYPAFVDWLVEAAHVPGDSRRLARFALERLQSIVGLARETDISGEISELIGPDALSVSSMPLLGMGRDTPDGTLWLRGDQLDLAWSTATSEAYFERVTETMRRIAAVLGAHYVGNPMWLRKRIVTAHPVGGAPMGHNRSVGVCDAYGEVFGHPGLYIADAAVMPGPVGANPSMTIAALADRMCTRLLEQRPAMTATGAGHGASAHDDGSLKINGKKHRPPVHRPDRTSLSFTEEMSGTCTATARPGLFAAPGQGQPQPMAFRLTITADDVERFLNEPEHTARAEGWIDAASIGGRHQVQRGWFNLFAPDDAPDRRLMRYRLQFADASGQPRTVTGVKDIFHGPPSRIWPDTSTLHIKLLEGHVAEGEDDDARVLATGTLHLRLTAFARQLTTFRTKGPHSAVALERFGRFFAGQLWDVYGPQPTEA